MKTITTTTGILFIVPVRGRHSWHPPGQGQGTLLSSVSPREVPAVSPFTEETGAQRGRLPLPGPHSSWGSGGRNVASPEVRRHPQTRQRHLSTDTHAQSPLGAAGWAGPVAGPAASDLSAAFRLSGLGPPLTAQRTEVSRSNRHQDCNTLISFFLPISSVSLKKKRV